MGKRELDLSGSLFVCMSKQAAPACNLVLQTGQGAFMMHDSPASEKLSAERLQRMKSQRLLIFLGISAAYVISYFHRSAPAVVGPEIARDLALAPASLGVLGSMYFWAYAGAQLPAGVLADTWGARKTMSVFVLIAAIGGLLFALSPNLSLLSLGRFLVGLGVGFIYVPAVRIMTDWYKPDELATYSGVLLAIGNLGALVSAAPLVAMMEAVGWRYSFLIVAAFTVAAAFFCWTFVRNTPAELGLPGPRELMGLEPSPPAEKVRLRQTLIAVLSNKRFYLLGALMFCYYGTLMSVGSLWAGPYLQDVYGLTKQLAGNIIMMFPLGMVLGCPLSGYLSDKILKSRKKVLLIGASLHILSYIPLIFMGGSLSTAQLYMLFLWYGITGGAFVSNFACAKETVDPRFAGTAIGAVNVFLFSGGAFFQAVMGLVIGRFSALTGGGYSLPAYQAALAVAFAGLLLGTILFCFFKEKPID